MSLVKQLKESRESWSVNHIRLLQDYRHKENTLHLFVEGDDDFSFYNHYIRNHYNHSNRYRILPYISKGKENVYKNYENISWDRYDKNRILFFVDRDYSDFLSQTNPSDSNIFETKYYSIENYLVTKEFLMILLQELFYITNTKDINILIEDFDKQYNYFIKSLLVFSAWIIYHKQIGSNMILKDMDLSKLFGIYSNQLLRKRVMKLASLDTYLNVTTKAGEWKNILKIAKLLKQDYTHKIYIRGKFELYFLVKYITLIQSTPNIKANFSIPINTKNAIQVLSPRLPIPEDLNRFLLTNLQAGQN